MTRAQKILMGRGFTAKQVLKLNYVTANRLVDANLFPSHIEAYGRDGRVTLKPGCATPRVQEVKHGQQ